MSSNNTSPAAGLWHLSSKLGTIYVKWNKYPIYVKWNKYTNFILS